MELIWIADNFSEQSDRLDLWFCIAVDTHAWNELNVKLQGKDRFTKPTPNADELAKNGDQQHYNTYLVVYFF